MQNRHMPHCQQLQKNVSEFRARKFYGITESTLQCVINKDQQRKMHVIFDIKPKLRPVQAMFVMHIMQIDLVDMKAKFSGIWVDVFWYVVAFDALFWRYACLRRLTYKKTRRTHPKSAENFGVPKILQSDCATEFKGKIKHLGRKARIEGRRSRPPREPRGGKYFIRKWILEFY